mmetsp:Transcript_38407/g.53635  ORF Transcript_38407/g.53635 Transcript_38407/m.53635 type:complete len:204 (+) Transcript_38407:321-932(+)
MARCLVGDLEAPSSACPMQTNTVPLKPTRGECRKKHLNTLKPIMMMASLRMPWPQRTAAMKNQRVRWFMIRPGVMKNRHGRLYHLIFIRFRVLVRVMEVHENRTTRNSQRQRKKAKVRMVAQLHPRLCPSMTQKHQKRKPNKTSKTRKRANVIKRKAPSATKIRQEVALSADNAFCNSLVVKQRASPEVEFRVFCFTSKLVHT